MIIVLKYRVENWCNLIATQARLINSCYWPRKLGPDGEMLTELVASNRSTMGWLRQLNQTHSLSHCTLIKLFIEAGFEISLLPHLLTRSIFCSQGLLLCGP